MPSSEFLNETERFDRIEALERDGNTSLSYLVRIDGKEYFMKKLRPELAGDERYRNIFHKEFEIGRSLHSRHIVKYRLLREDNEGIYILMEHINGLNIKEKIKDDPVYFSKPYNTEKLFTQALQALKALHRKNIAYLDLKPENIILTQISNDVKIVDLGFCFDDTYSYTAGYNKEFAAPELFSKDKTKIGAHSDIYSLGKLMHYIYTSHKGRASNLMKHILKKCTEESLENRYTSVDEILADLRKGKHIIIALCFALIIITIVAFFFGLF